MKKVTLTVVVRNEDDAKTVADQMEDSPLAQMGIYTIACGHIQNLTEFDIEEVEGNCPPEILNKE